MFDKNFSENNRQAWSKQIIGELPRGVRVLDAGGKLILTVHFGFG